jgi:hypothetical protein
VLLTFYPSVKPDPLTSCKGLAPSRMREDGQRGRIISAAMGRQEQEARSVGELLQEGKRSRAFLVFRGVCS